MSFEITIDPSALSQDSFDTFVAALVEAEVGDLLTPYTKAIIDAGLAQVKLAIEARSLQRATALASASSDSLRAVAPIVLNEEYAWKAAAMLFEQAQATLNLMCSTTRTKHIIELCWANRKHAADFQDALLACIDAVHRLENARH